MFFYRQNDFKKINSENTNSLLKAPSFFSKTVGPQYGGSSLGPYLKTSNKKQSIYYLARHGIEEYFSCEVLLALGINTPKIRFVGSPQQGKDFLVASEAIANYIPIGVLRPDAGGESLPIELALLRKTYMLDIENQLIINKIDNTIYKISGNLFALDIAALFISDSDLQPKGNNLGLIKKGNRFYAITIDKDDTAFKGNNYYQLQGCLGDDLLEDKLFKNRIEEQLLFIINAIKECLVPDITKHCTFDKIFLNSRVANTPFLKEYNEKYCTNIKKSALYMVNYYDVLGKNILADFSEREKIRILLADKVIQLLELNGVMFDSSEVRNILIEDLRAPYYMSDFLGSTISIHDIDDNPKLVQRLLVDMTKELNMGASYTFDHPSKMEFDGDLKVEKSEFHFNDI